LRIEPGVYHAPLRIPVAQRRKQYPSTHKFGSKLTTDPSALYFCVSGFATASIVYVTVNGIPSVL